MKRDEEGTRFCTGHSDQARRTACAYLRTIVTRTFLDTRRRRRAREQAVAQPPERPVPRTPSPPSTART
ncbi:hypothetical protein [Actinosynnema pretiosum]|uniref:hypothetical protein n=1 Tax=Actinosynnema pretiosum TaxID=42197 RepID=UPI001E52BD6E|nr:hypothetical protein [Actinosynnema pretiosum]